MNKLKLAGKLSELVSSGSRYGLGYGSGYGWGFDKGSGYSSGSGNGDGYSYSYDVISRTIKQCNFILDIKQY